MRPTATNVYGTTSLIVWSLVMIVTLKYVLLVMRADNHGEGGIMALVALVERASRGVARPSWCWSGSWAPRCSMATA